MTAAIRPFPRWVPVFTLAAEPATMHALPLADPFVIESAVNTARPLAAERDYLHLDRKEHEDALAVAITALDNRLLAPALAAIARGEIEERPDWVASGYTLFRLMGVNGAVGTAHLPSGILSPNVRAKLYDLLRAVEAELP